jgi:hypothetical protein
LTGSEVFANFGSRGKFFSIVTALQVHALKFADVLSGPFLSLNQCKYMPSGELVMSFKQPGAEDNPLSDEEDRAHRLALEKMRAEMVSGRTFSQAMAAIADLEKDLRLLVIDDLLKIIIAEEHFGEGRSVEEVAMVLGLSAGEVATARDQMLMEVGMEMARQYRQEIARISN